MAERAGGTPPINDELLARVQRLVEELNGLDGITASMHVDITVSVHTKANPDE